MSHFAQSPHQSHVFATCSFGGWCAVFGAEPSPQVYECVDHAELLSSAVLVARWNPVVPSLLAFAEGSRHRAAVVHVVDCSTQTHQVLRLGGLTGVTGLEWCSRFGCLFLTHAHTILLKSLCSSGVTLFVAANNVIVELRVSPANVMLKHLATLAAE